jgi:hypothetical protein
MVDDTSKRASTYEYKIDSSLGVAQQSPSKTQKGGAKIDNLWNSILQDVVKREE